MEHLLDRNSDVVFITETWLSSEKNNITADVKTYGYELIHKIRKDRSKERGGGVGIIVRSTIPGKPLPCNDFCSFECNIVKIPLKDNKFIVLISVYRLQFIPVSEFISEFSDLLETYAVLNEYFVIAGDVNIHTETDESSSRKFLDLLDLYDLRQHVVGPTHIMGHTIDVIITPNKESFVTDIAINHIDLSHHFLIDFKITAQVITNSTKHIKYRTVKNIDSTAFCKDLTDKFQASPATKNMAEKVENYNSALSEVLDKHAPIKTKQIKVVATAPWFDVEYISLRKQRRKAEKKFRKSKSQEDKDVYINLRKQTTELAKDKKLSYVTKKLNEGTAKTLYSVVNNLIDNNKEIVLPSAESDKELADGFLQFFKQKIAKIRSNFPVGCSNTSAAHPNPNIQPLSTFEPTNPEELRKIVTQFGVKCSPEDPAPSPVLLTHLDTLLPVWVEIVNLSLEVGSMDSLKSAVILPLIKELTSTTDTDDFKNYRPVSNLVFISKLIERVVDIRLEQHLQQNNLTIDQQYGYKKSHSTEMLLLKVMNNLFESCDKNIPSVVLLLDLSAAFDTVDHTKLLQILYEDIGITGTALNWFKSFLTKRTHKVKVGDTYSLIAELLYGVAQGSILGPRLFNIYIRSLYKHIDSSKFQIEGFADDHQLVKQFVLALETKALGDDITNCLKSISQWMNEHFLCINQSKTKILVVAPPSVKEKICIGGVMVEDSCIRFVESAKNLGFILDSVLSFEKQINKVVKSCFNTIRKLSKVKIYLTQQQLQTLVSSLIFSRLDYCNSLYYGLPANLIKKLQHVQNCAARLVLKRRVPFRSSLNGVFTELHWLKVKFRIIYKILLVVYNCLHQHAPNEVTALVQYGESVRTMKLQETRVSNKYGDRAFSHVAPKLWNLLPNDIRSQQNTLQFKKKLKSFLIDRGDEFIEWIKRQ